MPSPFLATYADLVDYLSVSTGSGATTPEQADVRMAVFRAYQRLGTEHNWAYYKRGLRVIMQAPFETGTITYAHTGGASERLVTFTDAPPSWTRYGTLVINNTPCRIESALSSTVFTLDATLNPGQDVAAGTSFTLYQTIYDLPGDFRGAWEPTDGDSRTLCYVSPAEIGRLERVWPTQSSPWYWTLMPSPDSYAAWTLRTHGYSSELKTIDLMYQGRPRALRFTGYETNSRAGTVTISADGVTVTGTNTAFSSAMVGSVFRVTSGTTHPTGIGGVNAWDEQKIIVDVQSATSLTVDSAFESAYSGKKYVIADPIDVDEDLYELLIAGVVYQLASIRRSENVGTMLRLYKDTLRMTLENNSKLREVQRMTAPVYALWSGVPSSWRNEIVIS